VVKQAEQTDARIAELSHSASRIGDVVKLITTIAGQTNLLALATENAKATETIKTLIAEMQHMTKDSVAAINEISGTIGRISEIAPTITRCGQCARRPNSGDRS